MDEVVRFVTEQNINRFTDQLYNETDPQKQEVLRNLLLEEENRFGFYSGQLEITQRHLFEVNSRINRQKQLITKMETNGHDIGQANQFLFLLVEMRTLFDELHASILDRINRNAL
jgi:hypothetical protein